LNERRSISITCGLVHDEGGGALLFLAVWQIDPVQSGGKNAFNK